MTWDNRTQFRPGSFDGSVGHNKGFRGNVMPSGLKGSIAGFIATVVLSALILIFNNIGILKELDIIEHIDKLGSIQRVAAWVDHFIVGALLWGPIFAGFDATTSETRPRWQKGLMFGVITWFMMMIIFMPVIGGTWKNLFGWQLGWIEPVGMFGMNMLYGLVLGVVFDLLDRQFPTKELISSQPPLPEMAEFNKPND
jgi:MFS family permease